MNVLVYSGPEILASSLSHCITSLRTLLVPHYAVQSITRQSLSSQAWRESCALLVFPASKGAPVNAALGSAVEQYVQDGGKLLTVGATVTLQTQETGSGTALRDQLWKITLPEQSTPQWVLSDKSSGCKIYVSFEGHSLEETQFVSVALGDLQVDVLPYSGGFKGIDWTNSTALTPIAHVVEDGSQTGIAAARLSCGEGSAVFCAALLDLPLSEEPLLSRLSSPPSSMSHDALQVAEVQRRQLLSSLLQTLGLVLPETTSVSPSPLPQLLTCAPSKPWVVDSILRALSIEPEALLSDKPVVLEDTNDTFRYHLASASWEVLRQARDKAVQRTDPSSSNPKDVLVCRDGLLPQATQTPLFDIRKFYDELATARHRSRRTEREGRWGMGEALLYGEVVTSTQTIIDKNARLLSSLPTPFVSLASHQLSGRGRGANIWLSPSGCLQFSLLVRVSLSELPASKLVFVQYLFGLAVVEACRDEGVLGEQGKRVRLKWPNDVYAVTDSGATRKIGGILVNTSFSGGKAEIVIGSGLNVFNPPPIQSLLQLVPSQAGVNLTMERTAATILTRFEELWDTFLQHDGSFEPFLDLYYERWLHSDQLVELTTVTPSQMVRIVGITSNYGLLRTMSERDGWSGSSGGMYIDLQPDGNSFDLMAGLIKAKT